MQVCIAVKNYRIKNPQMTPSNFLSHSSQLTLYSSIKLNILRKYGFYVFQPNDFGQFYL
ncbi:MAG: hypothetical protein POELPBGB_02018 [Bacteroidia bacterium]|nr:hypothetical protein [Bacteroidia bacterium]